MAATQNIVIDQGAEFTYVFQLQGLDTLSLDGTATPYASMKTEYEANTSMPFVASLTGSNLTISMHWSNTASLTSGTWVYDAVLVDEANALFRVVEGRVTVRPQVTVHP